MDEKIFEAAFDITGEMIEAGCSDDDISRVVDLIMELFMNRRRRVIYTCRNGRKVIIEKTGLEIKFEVT